MNSAGENEPPRRRRMASEDRRRQMIAVAQELFAARPYSEVSTTDIARAAGVTHGLLTYHFGSKRNLYLAVIRETLWIPRAPVRVPGSDRDVDAALDRMVEWWLTQVGSHSEMFLLVLGARGVGRDRDVEELLEEYEERGRADIVGYLTARDPRDAPPELWALVAAWQGLAEAAAVEWLKRKRITRAQTKVLVLEGLRRLLKMQRLLSDAEPESEPARPPAAA